MTDLSKMTIAGARDAMRAGDFTSVELTQSYLNAIEGASALNAYSTNTPEKALAQAAAADSRIAAGDAPDMCGIPLGIKDLFCTEDIQTQAGSHILDGFKPKYESTITTQLWDRGAVMLGKLNMDEFAMGSSNETSYYGPVTSPWRRGNDDAALTPGGSSGGSAAAVSADLCLGATGTDTGGSIRQPAAFTGIVGVKPTYGRASRWGVVAFASSLDQAGPMVKTVRDSAIMLEAMCGHDPKDSTSADMAVPNFEAALSGDIRGKKIGIPKEYRIDGMPAEIETLWAEGAQKLRDAGAEIRYDGVKYGHRAKINAGEGIDEMYMRTRAEGFGEEVQRRVMIGAYVLSAGFYDAYYIRAQKVRTLIKQDFEKVFADGIDQILTPATPSAAFGLGEMANADPIKMYLNDVFTVTVNLAGLPGISVPAGIDTQGLPLGLQLIGQPWGEADMLNTAYVLEQASDFTAKPVKWW